MTAVCKPHDLTFFQFGLLRFTGLSGMGLVGGRLLREPLKLMRNLLWLEPEVFGVIEGVGVPVIEVIVGVAATDGSARVVAMTETVASSANTTIVVRMRFMNPANSVAEEDKFQVTFSIVSELRFMLKVIGVVLEAIRQICDTEPVISRELARACLIRST